MTVNKLSAKRIIAFASAMLLAAVMLMSFAGCSVFDMIFGGPKLEFTKSSITLQVGELYDLESIIDSQTSRYELTSSDTAVVSISGAIANARKAGIAFITLENGLYSDKLRVTVTEKQADSLSIAPSGFLVQTMDDISEVLFLPECTGSIVNRSIKWYVDDALKASQASSKPFCFTPNGAGAFVVKAECGELTAECTVRCYYRVDAEVECVNAQSLSQTDYPFTAVKFDVDVESNAQNPPDHIQWYADGVLLYEGEQKTFEYIPTPGRHTLSAVVNGIEAYTVNGFFKGAVIPSAPTFDFDNLYPHIYVRYEAKGLAKVEIVSPQGVKTEYAQSDPKYAHLFTDRSFDAASAVSLCSTDNTRRAYTVRVKSLGDGDAFTESEYSEKYLLTQLPQSAKKYWETQLPSGDLYITSEREYVAALEHYVYFRDKTVKKPKVSFDCYIAFDMPGDEDDLWNNAFPLAATSGMYIGIDVSLKSNILRTSFTVDTVNNPSEQSSASGGSGYALQLHAILPHINYDSALYRPDDYVFPIDKSERSIGVAYSDELYLAVQNGVKPLPKSGSAAEALYARARDILRKICTESMSDVEKVHAIYDWLMWQVTYDTPATEVKSGGEKLTAYYLEGVFGDGKTSFGGVVCDPYAVCDGISKAFSLLCNIEGIPCVRVIGEAGLDDDLGGHAWNKVFVNNGWYAVDCTWGDAQAFFAIEGRNSYNYELGLHDRLLLTDAQMSGDHFEPYMSGSSAIVYAPQTTDIEYNIYKNMSFNGTAIDCYIALDQSEADRIKEIVTAFAKSCDKSKTVIVPGGPNDGVYDIDYVGMEIYIEGGQKLSDSQIKNIVTSSVRAVRPDAEVKVFAYGDILLVLMRR